MNHTIRFFMKMDYQDPFLKNLCRNYILGRVISWAAFLVNNENFCPNIYSK